MFEEVNALLDKAIALGVPGFDYCLFQDGKEVFRRRHIYKGGELMNVYSCSKTVTGVVAAQLYDKGLYELDTPVYEFLPEYKNITVRQPDGTIAPAKNVMTMRNILTMTSGMDYGTGSAFTKKMQEEKGKDFSTRDLAYCKAQDPLAFEPGTGWLYSLGLDVFGAAVEVMTGMRFGEYVQKNIFDPLGMTDSGYAGSLSDKVSNTPQFRFIPKSETEEAHYQELNEEVQIPLNSSHYAAELGGSGIISTVDDMIKFLEGWRTGKLMSERAAKFLMTDHLNEAERKSKLEKKNRVEYGYGIAISVPYYDNGRTDYGWGGAAGASIGIDPARNISYYFSSHVIKSPFMDYRLPLLYAAQHDLDALKK